MTALTVPCNLAGSFTNGETVAAGCIQCRRVLVEDGIKVNVIAVCITS